MNHNDSVRENAQRNARLTDAWARAGAWARENAFNARFDPDPIDPVGEEHVWNDDPSFGNPYATW